MPTSRTRKTLRRKPLSSIPAVLREKFIYGHWWNFLCAPKLGIVAEPDFKTLGKLWKKYRGEILSDCVEPWAQRAFDGGNIVRENDDAARKWVRSEADEHARSNGCYFDLHAADRVVCFFERFLKHGKDEWFMKPFRLLDWQKYEWLMPLFGWKNKDNFRRYRTAYVEVPKKNGKSPVGSGIGLYIFIGDNAPGAQVFCAATDKKQAGIVFEEACNMVTRSDELRLVCKVSEFRSRIEYRLPGTASILEGMSGEAPSKEGLNFSGFVFDEVHAQRNARLWETIQYGGAARRQTLLQMITTAGWDRHSVCYRQHEHAVKIIEGVAHDDSFYPLIYAPDKDDDWKDPATWRKVNPSLGVTLTEDILAADCARAIESPWEENNFRRYHLNEWTEQETRWLSMSNWDKCSGGGAWIPLDDMPLSRLWAPQPGGGVAIPELLCGRDCYAGLDLASTTDIAAFVLVFSIEGNYICLPFFWIPEDNARAREDRDRVPYLTWAKQGFLEMTSGAVIDYDVIRKRINEIHKIVNIEQIAVDPWNSSQLSAQLDGDGFEMVLFRQGFGSMSAPTKDLEARVLGRTLHHGDNPVLRWMMSNVVVCSDPAGNLKLDKGKSTEKIDGIVALAMADDLVARNSAEVVVYDGNLTVV